MTRPTMMASAAALTAILIGSPATAQTPSVPATRGPAENGQPAWFLQGSFPDPTGRTSVDRNGVVTVVERADPPLVQLDLPRVPGCSRSPMCGNRAPGAPARRDMQRVQWEQHLGYTFTYPYHLPPGTGGVPAVARDSRGNLWVFQRAAAGKPQLFKFDPNYNLILTVGMDVLPYQVKAHGMAVDAQDNVYVIDTGMATVTKLSPEGRLLQVIGERGKRGDWDESKGQRLLWEPVMIAFAPNGDMYIAMGHANESPNDVGGEEPHNVWGVARVLHLDRNGNYRNQIFGNNVGMGKFDSTHGFAIDPTNGDLWIGDREQYRIVVYSADGKFLRTMQMRNLVCAIQFDPQGNPWMGSGQDGQFLKLSRDGRVIGAIGNGMGIGFGQFTEASYFVFDEQNNIYTGDTSVGRVTKMLANGRG